MRVRLISIEAEGLIEPTVCPACLKGLYRHGSKRQAFLDTPKRATKDDLTEHFMTTQEILESVEQKPRVIEYGPHLPTLD